MYAHNCAYVYLYIILANHIRLLKTRVQLLQYNVSCWFCTLLRFMQWYGAYVHLLLLAILSSFLCFSLSHRCCKTNWEKAELPAANHFKFQKPVILIFTYKKCSCQKFQRAHIIKDQILQRSGFSRDPKLQSSDSIRFSNFERPKSRLHWCKKCR